MSGEGIALYHLGAPGVPGNHHLAQGREALAVIESLKDFIQCCVGTQRRRAQRRITRHPVIGVPAQYGVGQGVARAIRIIEKLWRDDQGCG